MEYLVNKDKFRIVFEEIQDVISKHELTSFESMMIISEVHNTLLMDRYYQSQLKMGIIND